MTAYTLLEDTLLTRLDAIHANRGEPLAIRLGWRPYGVLWRECRRLFGDEVLDAPVTVWHELPVVLAGEGDWLLVVWRVTMRNVEVRERR